MVTPTYLLIWFFRIHKSTPFHQAENRTVHQSPILKGLNNLIIDNKNKEKKTVAKRIIWNTLCLLKNIGFNWWNV